MEDYVFLRENTGICRRVVREEYECTSLSLALNNDKFLYENEYKTFDIYRERNSDSVQCSYELFYQGGAF